MRYLLALILSFGCLYALDPFATDAVIHSQTQSEAVQSKTLVDAWYAAKVKPIPAQADMLRQMYADKVNMRIVFMDRNLRRIQTEANPEWTPAHRLALIKAEVAFTMKAISEAEEHGVMVASAKR